MKKLIISTFLIGLGLIASAQLNYQMALNKAYQVDTDGEIEVVMQSYGFMGDINAPITEPDKLKALYLTVLK